MNMHADISGVLREYVSGSEHPDLRVYRNDVSANDEVWRWRTRHFCDLGNFYDKRILEVGCGFGWDAVGLSLIGGNEVVASDVLPSMIDGMTQCLETMKAKGLAIPITPLQGDICKLDLPDSSFDGIFSTEAIEHVHDLDLMFRNCYRLLKPGGRAILVNDSNRYNADARNHSWGGWTERDESWEHAHWLKTEVRPVEHSDAKPYGVMREEMIRAAAPDLAEEAIGDLRFATAGMIRPEIEAAVQRFKRDGFLPTRDPFRWCRNPETGEYSERLLDPFELKQMLRSAGFKVELRHLFRKLPYRLLNHSFSKVVSKRLFALRPQFVLMATKPR